MNIRKIKRKGKGYTTTNSRRAKQQAMWLYPLVIAIFCLIIIAHKS